MPPNFLTLFGRILVQGNLYELQIKIKICDHPGNCAFLFSRGHYLTHLSVFNILGTLLYLLTRLSIRYFKI